MSFLHTVRDVFRNRQQMRVEHELLELLKRHRPSGLELPLKSDGTVESAHNIGVMRAAAKQLIIDHPELEIVRTDTQLTLCFRDDLDPTISHATRGALGESNFIVTRDGVKHV